MAIKLMFITNDCIIAEAAQAAGVDRIFIDLEKIGKFERQGHLDTVKSSHSLQDISKLRKVINNSELLVRINPIHEFTSQEIEEVITRGADIVMLPMFKTAREVDFFVRCVNGRAKTCLLLETSQALVRLDEILDVGGIDEVHIGLNDLHLSMGVSFMFELLSGGIVEYICNKIKAKGIKYGFGGIARIGQGTVPAELILTEHYRLGSQMTILSRSFCNVDKMKSFEQIQRIFVQGLKEIRGFEEVLFHYDNYKFEYNRQQLINKVYEVSGKKYA